MKVKNLVSILCSIAITTSIITGCGANDNSTSSQMDNIEEKQPVTLDITALKGPTGMGLVQFMDEVKNGNITDNEYNFTIANSPDEITSNIVSGDIDIATVPANLASILYNNTQGQIETLAINTLGVLYIVESGNSVSNIQDLKGKTIYASGKGLTPEYTLNYILSKNGIDPLKDVQIEWKSEHSECLSALMANENAIAMLPQPFVTTAQTKSEKIRIAINLNDEWNSLQSKNEISSSLVTGVVIARKEIVEQNPEAISQFLDHYKKSVEFTNTNVEKAAELVGKYEIVPQQVAIKAIPECNITFIEGTEMKEKLSGYLSVLNEQNPKTIGGQMPEDDFYYKR